MVEGLTKKIEPPYVYKRIGFVSRAKKNLETFFRVGSTLQKTRLAEFLYFCQNRFFNGLKIERKVISNLDYGNNLRQNKKLELRMTLEGVSKKSRLTLLDAI